VVSVMRRLMPCGRGGVKLWVCGGGRMRMDGAAACGSGWAGRDGQGAGIGCNGDGLGGSVVLET
jgi:hypothetical protein